MPLHAIIMTRFRQIWNPGCYSSLTVFHYLPLACVAYYLRCFVSELPAGIVYIVVGISAFAGALFLYEIISRIPIIRWCVLGVKNEKKYV